MADAARPEVRTRTGIVRGIRADAPETARHVAAFRSIPFAAPPTGERRFAAPEPPTSWSGVRDASTFGPAAPQPGGGPLGALVPDMEPDHIDEDCLTLNVWTPALPDPTTDPTAEGSAPIGPGRAVLVWFHGGAFAIGASSLPTYDGTCLASVEDVVVVSVNYRLGALGWLLVDLPGTVANAGLLDQIAALSWVRDNIAAFGGDPERVTVFGESAGGGSVLSLLSAPAARGLFHRAIVQSGATDLVLTLGQAATVRAALADELGIEPGDLPAWRGVPVDALLAAQARVGTALAATVGLMPFHPVADGTVLPAPWQDVAEAGEAANVPLVIGTTRDEMALFARFDPSAANLDEDGLVQRLRTRGVPDPQLTVAAYRSDDPGASAPAIWSRFTTDTAMWLPAVRYATAYAAHQPRTWMYRFDWEAAAPGLGACHAIDIPFPFGATQRHGWERFVANARDAASLSRTVQALWAGFARDGEPPAVDGLRWLPYDVVDPAATIPSGHDDRATLVLGSTVELVHDPRSAIRRLAD